jgi:hypothetical protein
VRWLGSFGTRLRRTVSGRLSSGQAEGSSAVNAGSYIAENEGLGLAADTEAYVGHLGKSRDLTRRAVDSAIRADNKEDGAIWQAIAAQREAVYGNTAQARQSAAEALKLVPAGQGVEVEAALTFAMAGDTPRAESLAQDLGKRFPLARHPDAVALVTSHSSAIGARQEESGSSP